ncbi:PhzF family phenazine biosynthesis protein [Alteromonas sp.]|nr:PhzF family phenazine biosynthesis protein [Alteromonas sp.]
MELAISVIDAFTDTIFKGNPAAVIILDSWLADTQMQNIAAENNLSETAFLVNVDTNQFHIRWFSPLTEIDFCGHATLASAYELFSRNSALHHINFIADAVGDFSVTQTASGMLAMDFPNTCPTLLKPSDVPHALLKGLSIPPAEVLVNNQAYMVVYNSPLDVKNVQRDNAILATLAPHDVVVTSHSDNSQYDFISRYFWPANGGDEDPVTGSIHTGLAPFWAKRLGKTALIGYQASARGGIVHCEMNHQRVIISGHAVAYLKGTITI